jgi:hypothetical protein
MASQTIGTLVEAEIQSMIDSCARAMRAKDAARTLSPKQRHLPASPASQMILSVAVERGIAQELHGKEASPYESALR